MSDPPTGWHLKSAIVFRYRQNVNLFRLFATIIKLKQKLSDILWLLSDIDFTYLPAALHIGMWAGIRICTLELEQL